MPQPPTAADRTEKPSEKAAKIPPTAPPMICPVLICQSFQEKVTINWPESLHTAVLPSNRLIR